MKSNYEWFPFETYDSYSMTDIFNIFMHSYGGTFSYTHAGDSMRAEWIDHLFGKFMENTEGVLHPETPQSFMMEEGF